MASTVGADTVIEAFRHAEAFGSQIKVVAEYKENQLAHFDIEWQNTNPNAVKFASAHYQFDLNEINVYRNLDGQEFHERLPEPEIFTVLPLLRGFTGKTIRAAYQLGGGRRVSVLVPNIKNPNDNVQLLTLELDLQKTLFISLTDRGEPVLATYAGLTVLEGSTTTISNAVLDITDSDTANASIVYTITTSPVNGRVELSTAPGVAITTFTEAQLAANQVRYVHNGSETASDSFSFNYTDGLFVRTGFTFNFTVTPVNDAPTGANNTLTTLEDTQLTFTAANFGFTDVEPHAFAAVVVSTLPAAGSLTE